MSKIIKIDPLTRVEGHLKIETELSSNKVIDARVVGQMYRGFERLLEGRHPVDAARIAQRTCGICHEVHGVASVIALEKLYNIKIPKNGEILRNLILGLHIATDHLIHFYAMCVPDYVDFTNIKYYKGNSQEIERIKRWLSIPNNHYMGKKSKNGKFIRNKELAIGIILNYFNMIKIRSEAASGIAIIGSKTPFAQALMPGGITTTITENTLMKYYNTLKQTSDFINNSYIPDLLVIASEFEEYFNIGQTYDKFYCNSFFNDLEKPLINGGVYYKNNITKFEFDKITENIENSYFNDDFSPNENKKNAYSWIKALRYENEPLEVGPIARLTINNNYLFQKYRKKFKNTQNISSVMSRLLARAVETKLLTDHMFKIIEKYEINGPTIKSFDLSTPVTGKGTAFTTASRGDLIHHIESEKGLIKKYKMIVPSTWNFGPTHNNIKGVVEKALIGTQLSSNNELHSMELGRIVRSFDPCTACSVH